jgi:hypothetical protein
MQNAKCKMQNGLEATGLTTMTACATFQHSAFCILHSAFECLSPSTSSAWVTIA